MGKFNKEEAFEYLVYKLVEWFEQSTGKVDRNDLSTLKVLKLTFFVSAVGTTKKSKETLLDDVFDKFVAMPYGHVESDVYSGIKKKVYLNINVDNKCTKIKESFNPDLYDSNLKKKIGHAVDALKEVNPNLIKMSSFDLVDLSHSWYSWQKYYRQAKDMGRFSEEIPVQEIKNEHKIYQI